MPRIVPLQLLRCLKVLLDDNGGILSVIEVKRIAGLMTKYSKKLVSKCIYVQILKCTKTELLGEFMGVGGWSLVYNWLNDAIRAMNWPLVQEILELLLLCPVDVNRLKINSAPKLVKGLCKDGGNEGVRILAKRLVEQWLKVVTENTDGTTQQPVTSTPQITSIGVASVVSQGQEQATMPAETVAASVKTKQSTHLKTNEGNVDQDPLADIGDVPPEPTSYSLTPAQKKANEMGLVYKIVVKNGQQVLAKVAKAAPQLTQKKEAEDVVEDDKSEIVHSYKQNETPQEQDNFVTQTVPEADEEDTTTSLDKQEKESESSGCEEESIHMEKAKKVSDETTLLEKKSEVVKDNVERKDRKSSKDSKENKEQDRDRKSSKDKERDRKSSSSTHRSSSSNHKSSTSKNSSSSSSSKSKSATSAHRSSSDKHRSEKDKDRSSSSSNKDRDRKEGGSNSSSGSLNKHRSHSSKTASSSSNSKERHRDKDREKTSISASSSSSLKKLKEREKDDQAEKDKDTLAKMIPASLDRLGKIPKKLKDEDESDLNKVTSITIPSKKASMSIEIRRDSEKTKTVKTYKSKFRSHGLTEEAPPPPSRKGLKKPSSNTSAPGTVIPTSLPSSLKRTSPPPRDSPTEKKPKIDLNNVSFSNDKPGAIKLIAPKKIQTLVETNLFSDALSAATGPKKLAKRKRSSTQSPGQGKEGSSPPTSPDAPKVTPLKFYQDTLDESKTEEKQDKENDCSADKDNNGTEDDDDIPLKKVKEDIEQQVLREQKVGDGAIDITSEAEDEKQDVTISSETVEEAKKPGPGCGPDGPPGVLMLHRRKGPKKKLSWRPQEHLEQIRYFELDETERVNVTKTTSSFMDMKNMERFSERDAINMSRRGFNHEDNMEPQTLWRPLIEVDDVPSHPDGNQSKQRKVQADRELTTLRALYFSQAMIPDSPAEAELEPHLPHDIPVIPLDDITGNPDAVNDYTNMPWPEPKGSPQYGENSMAGTGGLSGLGGPVDMFGGATVIGPTNPFNTFMNAFVTGPNGSGNIPSQQHLQMQIPQTGQQTGWQPGLSPNSVSAGSMIGNHFNSSPNIDMGPSCPPQNFMGQFGTQFVSGGNQFIPPNFNSPNYASIGPGGPMGSIMNGAMGPTPVNVPPILNAPIQRSNNRNTGGNWRSGGSNFQDNAGGGGVGIWRPAGSGPNRGVGNINNNGVCKAFMRGHCRLGKSCKFIHPKAKRI